MPDKIAIFLFRNNLRLHDQPFLQLAEKADRLLCLYPWPEEGEWLTDTPPQPLSSLRVAALHNALGQLQERLSCFGQVLWVYRGALLELPEILSRHYSNPVVFMESEPFPEEKALEELFRRSGLELNRREGRTLIHPDDLPFSVEKLPRHFTPFRHKVERSLQVREPLPLPNKLPPPPTAVPPEFKRIENTKFQTSFSPSLPQGAGEHTALQHLEGYTSRQGAIRHYKKTRNGFTGLNFSSKLSVFLALGSLSPRLVWQKVEQHETQYGATEDTYWLKFELLWRDFFRFQALKLGEAFFGRRAAYTLLTEAEKRTFDKWKFGRTGDALVDAAMRELAATGYMSNRARQNAASFLIYELGLPWVAGAAWFEHCLVDYDPASNYGNWAYIAGVRFDPRGGRRFNTREQAARYDPNGAYRKAWLEEF